ncbi:MAG TPA: YbfB/YjiJ family MFS transporter [Jatrophihabitantaceae bacterium]|nr:YbfB/YjiJ family MFS transporter [Jatrophihabitantaceae bacterium]
MTTFRHVRADIPEAVAASPRRIVIQAGAALAVSMGIGRFVYTPILPLMLSQAGLSAQYGSTLATANYVGYLAGALAGIFIPRLVGSARAMRTSLVVLFATLVLMGFTENHAAWFGLRLVAGAASALVFVIAVTAMLTQLRQHSQQLVGWGFGGVGAGIAVSGLMVLVVRTTSTWRAAWWASAVLALLLTFLAWSLRPEAATGTQAPRRGELPRTRPWFAALFLSYSLEGIGYIIAGTFLVAAVNQNSPAWVGSSAWVLVGLAALPASVVWARLGHRWSRPTLLCAALVIQAAGIALPALVGGVAPALISAVLFGATFLGVGSIALALGAYLQFPRAVALLTTGYSVGQILGPVIATPLVHNGYHVALLVGAALVLAAALAAAVLRIRFPHRVGAMVEPSRQHRPVAGPVAEVRS